MDKGAKFGRIELNEKDQNHIENNRPIFKRKISKITSNARKMSKKDKCMICGQEVEGFCNSHTIPAFCLRTIAKEGKLYTAGKLIRFPLAEHEKGVNNAGTFHLICNKCDSAFFQTYENP